MQLALVGKGWKILNGLQGVFFRINAGWMLREILQVFNLGVTAGLS